MFPTYFKELNLKLVPDRMLHFFGTLNTIEKVNERFFNVRFVSVTHLLTHENFEDRD